MISLIKRFFKLHIVRYGMVGGVGIPINLLALFVFQLWLGKPLYPLANAFAFIVSNLINFILNQLFTYREQVQGIHGWEWFRRFFKGVLTSLSSNLISYVIALALVYGLHVNEYLANVVGIVLAFIYNFFLSKKFVFRPTTASEGSAAEQTDVMTVHAQPKAETTPK